jgi:tetratricopeptide (TPR) repeat protein
LQASGKDALSFRDLARATAKELISAQRRLTVISLATQCRQLDEPDLADELVASALAGLSEREVLSVTLAGVEYYWQSGQQARADEVLHQLLKSDRGSTKAALWHLAAALATQQKKHGKAVAYLDRAMEIEYGDLPKIINLQQVRTDHARLLHAYQQVAYAHHMLDQPIERDFIRKVVRIADRWRSLDPEPTLACQSAARILKAVGANELAWDYLTTPCALHPNEAAPHLLLAQALRQDGDIELANRAYAVAFAAEPTNAQILWDQAQMLQQAGRHADALNVYRRLADGDWQPRFQGLKQQAKWQLGAR